MIGKRSGRSAVNEVMIIENFRVHAFQKKTYHGLHIWEENTQPLSLFFSLKSSSWHDGFDVQPQSTLCNSSSNVNLAVGYLRTESSSLPALRDFLNSKMAHCSRSAALLPTEWNRIVPLSTILFEAYFSLSFPFLGRFDFRSSREIAHWGGNGPQIE